MVSGTSWRCLFLGQDAAGSACTQVVATEKGDFCLVWLDARFTALILLQDSKYCVHSKEWLLMSVVHGPDPWPGLE